MAQYIYKHLLAWPVMLKDLEAIDEECFRRLDRLQQLYHSGDDLGKLDFDFSKAESMSVKQQDVAGKIRKLTNENFPDYMESNLKYYLLEQVKPQLKELILGFFDVIPEALLAVFDYEELEELLCGLTQINVDDWKENTKYLGEFEQYGADYPVCKWFWEIVQEFNHQNKAGLLQFTTGYSAVPPGGFACLKDVDGKTQKFTIYGVSKDACQYPHVQTHLNRIILPMYESKQNLVEKLVEVGCDHGYCWF